MKHLKLVMLLMFVGACATTEKYEAVLNSWIGATEDELISAWGPPDQVYESGDKKYITYTSNRTVTIPGTSPTYETTFIGNTAYTDSFGGTPATTLNLNCKTSFTIVVGRISSWSYKGNDCTSY